MKKTLTLLSSAALAGSMTASGALIAGFDDWTEVSADTWNANITSSVTAQGVGTAVGTNATWFNFNNTTVQYGASGDGTWGTVGAGAGITAPSTTLALTEATNLANGGNGYIDFTITSTIGTDLELSSFNFDSARVRSNSATAWIVSVQSGALTNGTVATGTLNTSTTFEPLDNKSPNDFDVDLTGLADNTLDAGQSVVFRLQYTGGSEAGNGGNNVFLDNVAVFGDVVPEPSAVALGALALGLLGFRRRR